jgi:hypothetical protein
MPPISAFASIAIACCVVGPSLGALAPLPGTILVSTETSATIYQYDAANGSLVGELNVVRASESSNGLQGIDVLDGQIFLTAGFSSGGGGVGRVNAVTGEFERILEVYPQAFDHLPNGSFIEGGPGPFRGIRNLDFLITGIITLQIVPGTLDPSLNNGIAATSTGFVTTNLNRDTSIQFWDMQGNSTGFRFFNNELGSNPRCIEYDAETNDFWFGDSAGGGQFELTRYGPTSPDEVWSVIVPGQIVDLAYIPIPSPGASVLLGISVVCLFARRRR